MAISNIFFVSVLFSPIKSAASPLQCWLFGVPSGFTAIPRGEYKADVAFSNKFRYNVVRLFGVPYFEGIYIHKGNTEKDSLGCIIVGYNDKKGWVSRPTEALNKLMAAISGYDELKVIIQ